MSKPQRKQAKPDYFLLSTTTPPDILCSVVLPTNDNNYATCHCQLTVTARDTVANSIHDWP